MAGPPARDRRPRAGVIQAVGTQFNVHDLVSGDTRVSVLEGRVRLTTLFQGKEKTTSPAVLLAVGEEADLRLDGTIKRAEHAAVANTVAWRERKLVFAEIVSDFNRHNPSVQLRLEGVEGDVRRYDGVFDAADPEALAKMLSREADLWIERRNGEILIHKRK